MTFQTLQGRRHSSFHTHTQSFDDTKVLTQLPTNPCPLGRGWGQGDLRLNKIIKLNRTETKTPNTAIFIFVRAGMSLNLLLEVF